MGTWLSVLMEHKCMLFMSVQLCQLTKRCPTGVAVLVMWYVLYFHFIKAMKSI